MITAFRTSFTIPQRRLCHARNGSRSPKGTVPGFQCPYLNCRHVILWNAKAEFMQDRYLFCIQKKSIYVQDKISIQEKINNNNQDNIYILYAI
jgi:hypothetical protein